MAALVVAASVETGAGWVFGPDPSARAPMEPAIPTRQVKSDQVQSVPGARLQADVGCRAGRAGAGLNRDEWPSLHEPMGALDGRWPELKSLVRKPWSASAAMRGSSEGEVFVLGVEPLLWHHGVVYASAGTVCWAFVGLVGSVAPAPLLEPGEGNRNVGSTTRPPATGGYRAHRQRRARLACRVIRRDVRP
jgi:hypothetical protein